MRCHSVGCGMMGRTQPRTLSNTQSFAADSHDAVIPVYDEAGNVIETHEHTGDSEEP
jgi:hypothetical protein